MVFRDENATFYREMSNDIWESSDYSKEYGSLVEMRMLRFAGIPVQ